MLIGIDANEANTGQRVGSNIYSFELIKAIEAFDKQNEYKIYLSKKKAHDLPPERSKFTYRVIPPHKFWTRWRLPLDLYLSKPRPQLFFTPGHYAPLFAPMPRVISILDLSFLKYPNAFKPIVLKQLKTWTYSSAKKAAHILTISQNTKQDIIKNYHIPSSKITVTYPGVNQIFNQKVSSQEVSKVKQKYKLSGKYLLFLGTRQPKKNLSRLLQAHSSINRLIDEPITLVVAGKTWHQFANNSSATQTNPNLKEIGYVPDSHLPALTKGAQALVLPSLYEGFGFPVVEAMTVGTPVIVSNTSSLPEIVGSAGILIDPTSVNSITQGIKQILSLSAEKKVQLISRAKKQASLFSWQTCAKKTLEVLNEIAI